jgi:hypothetical protein
VQLQLQVNRQVKYQQAVHHVVEINQVVSSPAIKVHRELSGREELLHRAAVLHKEAEQMKDPHVQIHLNRVTLLPRRNQVSLKVRRRQGVMTAISEAAVRADHVVNMNLNKK